MKNLLLLLLLTISLLTYGQVPTSDLTGEYKFASGNLNNAIESNALVQTGSALTVVSDRAGGANRAISLNGDYLQKTANTSGNYDLSVSFWIKTSTNDAAKRVIIDQTERTSETESSSQTGWYVFLKDGKIGVAGNFQWAKQVVNIVSGTVSEATGFTGYLDTNALSNIADGNWHHVSITIFTNGGLRQGTAIRATYNVYIDNVLEATQNQTYFAPDHPWSVVKRFVNLTHPITIGNSKDGNSTNLFQESIDDIRFYSRTLSAGEVTSLFSEAGCASSNGVTAVAQDITVELDATGNVSISSDDIDNGSYADCDDPFTLSLDRTAFTCDDLGFNVVTLTATETYGAQTVSTATATVTVTYVPEVITQDIIIQLDASGSATISPSDINSGSPETSICESTVTFSLDKTTFTCSDIGANVVTLTADDGNGNTGSATAAVTVEDAVAPTVITQDVAIMVDEALGFVTIGPAEIDNGSTDNCSAGSLTMSLSKTKFTCEDTGDNIVTLTVEDEQGNTATADVTVTVTSEVTDETITATNANSCLDGTTGSTISTGSSIVGFNYTLRNSASDAIVDGPIAGTGSALDFSTGNLSETTTFNIIAEKSISSTQSALEFDGVNDYITLGTDDRGVTNQVTLATWIKTTSSGTSQFIVSKYDFVNGYYLFIDADGKTGISGRDGSGSARQSGLSTTPVNDGEWHYLVGTVNTTTGDWSIYVDGLLESATNNGSGPTLVNTASLLFGLTSGLYFTGEIDQVTLWNSELSASDILANFYDCLTGTETGIVGHYIFEDGSGTTLTDLSASALNGTLTNMDGATDWIDIISPSCGEKACDYQLSTEITIGDAIAPTAIAQDITAQIDAVTGEVTITADMIDNGSSDNCNSVLTKSLSKSTFTCEDVGDQTITLTVTDESGNVSTAQATVSVTSPIVDETVTTANTSFCPDGSIGTISIGSSVVGIDYYLRNSDTNEIEDGPIAGTGNALDFSTGNISSTTTFNVFAQNQTSENSALDFDGSNDFVDIPVNSTFDYANGYTFEAWVNGGLAGTTHLPIFSVGNGSISDIEVYAQANTNSIVIVHDRGEATFGGYTYTIPPADTWYHLAVTYDGTNIKVYYDGVQQSITNSSFSPTGALTKTAGLTMKIGKIANTAFGASGGHFLGQIDEVRVWNSVKSEADLLAAKNLCLDGTETDLEYYFKIDDNTGTTLTDIVNGTDGIMTNMDAATDWLTSEVDISCGSVCEFQMTTEITIGDLVDPVAVAQDITVELDAAGNATIAAEDVDNGSTDNCTLTLSLDKTDFTCADLGNNTVILTASDGAGNESTASAVVNIVDAIAPTVVLENIVVQLDLSGNATVDPNAVITSSLDNCTSNLTFGLSQSDFDCSDVGENTVTFTATDESGNSTSADVIITVEDNAPTVVTQNVTVELDANGTATVEASAINDGSSDDCRAAGDLMLSLNVTNFSCEDVGTANQVILTVTDLNGNVSTGTATVTVVDMVAPSVITQDISIVLDTDGNASITAAEIDNGSIDNCTSQGDLIYSLDVTSFDINDLGANTVTLTVTDASGNTATGTATVNVSDKELQNVTFTGVSDKTFGDANFTIEASVDSGLPVSFAVISGGLTITESGIGGSGGSTTLMITGAGTATIQASNDGDDTYAPLLETITIEVAKADQIITIDQISNRSNQAVPFDVIASTDSGLDLTYSVTGPATISGNSLTLTGVLGTVVVTATQDGNDNYNSASASTSFDVVEKQSQTITFSEVPDLIYGAEDQMLTATSSSNLSVSFNLISGPAVLNGSTLSITGSGDVVVEAFQAGDDDFLSESVQQTISISKASLTVTAENQTITYGDNIPVLTYSYSGFVNGEDVAVLDSEPSISTDATMSSDAGSYVINLDGGEAINYNLSHVDGTLTINKVEQIISIKQIEDKMVDDEPFDILATIDSGLDLTYDISGPATIAGTTITLDGTEGVVTVTVSQAGDINHIEASISEIFEVVRVLALGDKTQEIEVYPNPVINTLMFSNSKELNVKVLSLDGRILMDQKVNGSLNVENLKSGTYLIQMHDGEEVTTHRIIKAN